MAMRYSNFPHTGFNSQFFSWRPKKSPLAQIYLTKECRQKGRTDFLSKAWGLQVLSKTIWGANSQPTHVTTLRDENRTEVQLRVSMLLIPMCTLFLSHLDSSGSYLERRSALRTYTDYSFPREEQMLKQSTQAPRNSQIARQVQHLT